MKHLAGTMALLSALSIITAQPALPRFAVTQTRQVPINRLLRNVEYQRADAVSSTDRAMVDFRIGRLHAMAYALGVEQAPCDASATPGSKFELPDFGHDPDHLQYKMSNSNKNSAAAREHLKQAIAHLQSAVKTDPTLAPARLGLAWCTEQSGDKAAALKFYRQVFTYAYDGEKNSRGGMYNWSVACETAGYLIPLLNPVKDRQEIADLKRKVAHLEKLPRCVTPVMIPLAPRLSLKDLTTDRNVRFDLDGFGPRYYRQWLTPNAAWLVFDADGSGVIDSGLKLIGQSSFWIFWQNGYEVLRALDDNHDGKLAGSELAGLALWRDANSNGVSERAEVKPLRQHGIVALRVDCRKNSAGILWNENGVRFSDGTRLPSYDIMLPAAGRSVRQSPVPSTAVQVKVAPTSLPLPLLH
jgi:hypothetical protein